MWSVKWGVGSVQCGVWSGECGVQKTGWNVTKCHACHAKRRDNLLENPSKRRGFAASPIDTARPQENQKLETRHVGAAKTSTTCETSANFQS